MKKLIEQLEQEIQKIESANKNAPLQDKIIIKANLSGRKYVLDKIKEVLSNDPKNKTS